MNSYTCILHIPRHISPVQWFLTRANSPAQAARNAIRWFLDGDGSADWTEKDIDVPLVFAGRLEPELVEDEVPTLSPERQTNNG